jgi:hypothetical protein
MSPRPETTLAARQRLAAWLWEWEADRRLQRAAEEDGTTPQVCRYPVPLKRGAAPAAGQIRLLPPSTPATCERPVYVALLDRDGSRGWRVAPFGRFALPALPGELALRRSAVHLRVLCLWNRFLVSESLLRAAWPAGRLGPSERSNVAVVLAALEGAPLPDRLARRVGPPLVHPLDPRHAYVEEARGLRLAFEAAESESVLPGDALQMAAERRGIYGA